MNTVSIIGGTGMLGAPVAKQLLDDGFNVRIISRNPAKAREQLGDRFEYRQADLQDISALKIALDGTDAIHINLSGHSKETYYQSHVVGTQNILKAVEGKKLDCISMISSASAYPEFNDRWDNHYKWQAEQLLKDSPHPYLAFLPSWFMETLPLFVQNNRMVMIGKSTQPIHWVTAKEYAKVVSQSYQDANCRNQRISIYGKHSMTLQDAFTQYAEYRGVKLQRMPVWLAKLVGKLTGDPTLTDVADLMAHYERTGEKTVPNIVRTHTTLTQWMSAQPELV